MHKSFLTKVLFILTVLLFASCDKDFNEIGSGIVGDDHFDLLTKFDTPIVANTVATGAIESRNLPINPLGVYTDGANGPFGTTVASFATQLELDKTNPTIDQTKNPQVTGVELTVPYFNRFIETDSEGTRVYELDSVFGDGKFDLKVYRSGYYMRDISYADEEQQAQLFYTDEGPTFDNLKVGTPLNDLVNVPAQNSEFFFSNSGYDITTVAANGDETIKKFPPGMRLALNAAVFQDAVINAPSGMLANNNVFKNYFRGLYFKVEKRSDSPGELAMLDFKSGLVTVNYEIDETKCTTVAGVTTCTTTRIPKSIVLKMSGNTVSLLENQRSPIYNAGLAQAAGANERLFLKGGEGSVATIDLFGTEDLDGNDVPDNLDQIREQNWLINEANLTFYIDQDKMAGAEEPQRIYLYDLTNKRPVLDYSIDGTTSPKPKFKKYVYGGIMQREPSSDGSGRGVKYRIRLTNYINQLIKNSDSTNIRLGLSVTEDINLFSMVKLKTNNAILNNVVPTASAMSPLGTVLYGAHENVPADKRLKLEIYYTKPNP